ncbi:MAG: lysyl-tRNA synthetase class 2 [Oceanicoccus sp.]|jgi:lysyl-tRNA synthetase class 2
MASGEYQDRLRKMNELREMGINPYPARFESTHSVGEATKLGESETLREMEAIKEDVKEQVTIRGRMMTVRAHGKLTFANIKDITGTLQVCFMQDVLGKDTYKILRKFDMGDFVGVTGELFTTKQGQLTILVKEFTFLGKTLRPLPEKWHGLQDKETIYRQRYLDTLMNDDSMQRFMLRNRLTQSLRNYLNSHNFLEVETPILGTKASGATARPFKTHHNALDLDVYLRIAPELYLKACVAGGYEHVYEIARCFRNEGMDPSHLQEFTMLEFYGAYWNYEDNMNFTEDMLKTVIKEVFGTLQIEITDRDGKIVEVDFEPDWPRLDFGELIEKDCGLNIYDHVEDANGLRAAIKKAGIEFEDMDKMGYGNLCDYLYKKVSRPKLLQPCFVINHPASMKPLARRSDANPHFCETFQLLVNTWELINAYSEIVDPVDQRERFINQAVAQAGGDADAMEMDVEFLTTMEHGMPPMSGNGIGIDRLMTLLTGQDNLKDLVYFPLMRPTEENLKAEKKLREKAKKIYKKQQKAAAAEPLNI